ncbi:hypothetical protein ACFBZI_08575 [Moraxella sp. ZJ142]|uniref:hypothetical protein n=1 Tax=Moraxella marmotae TaxID=3344520 RepID=UPI0035D51A3C
MTYLLDMALDFYHGKMPADVFMLRYIKEREGKFTPMVESEIISQAECEIFSACDRFNPDYDVNSPHKFDIDEVQFRQEVEQALRSVGLI